MGNKGRVVIFLLIAIFAINIYANSSVETNSEETKEIIIDEDAKIFKVSSEACYQHIYYNAEDLTQKSYNVIIGEIVDLEYVDERALARTLCTVRVDEVLAGNEINRGSEIKILEYQGYCRLSKYVEVYGNDHFPDYDLSSADKEYLEYTVEGEPMVAIGDKFVYFLSPSISNNELDKQYYEIMGTFMGKYSIQDSLCERYKPTEDFYSYETKARSMVQEDVLTLDELRTIVLSESGD